MVASALIAFFLGPVWGFGFAATFGPAFGWVFAIAYAGRGPELERKMNRALLKITQQTRRPRSSSITAPRRQAGGDHARAIAIPVTAS